MCVCQMQGLCSCCAGDPIAQAPGCLCCAPCLCVAAAAVMLPLVLMLLLLLHPRVPVWVRECCKPRAVRESSCRHVQPMGICVSTAFSALQAPSLSRVDPL